MACRDAYKKILMSKTADTAMVAVNVSQKVGRLLFGVESKVCSYVLLQNNITHFEWVTRNKIPPIFWGRNILGKNHLTKEEINFLHRKGCKIAATCQSSAPKKTEEQGKEMGKQAVSTALKLGIPRLNAIFLEIDQNEDVKRDYMKGYATALLNEGYTPAFKSNTDAKFSFDREFSRGMQTDREIFNKCLIWATAPILKEYERMTTTHLIHPDNWKPFAPSAMTRKEIAVWQYGKDCHPIEDDNENGTTFNINLVRNEQVIIEKMF